MVHARTRLPAHRQNPCRGELHRLRVARDGRQRKPGRGGAQEHRSVEKSVQRVNGVMERRTIGMLVSCGDGAAECCIHSPSLMNPNATRPGFITAAPWT